MSRRRLPAAAGALGLRARDKTRVVVAVVVVEYTRRGHSKLSNSARVKHCGCRLSAGPYARAERREQYSTHRRPRPRLGWRTKFVLLLFSFSQTRDIHTRIHTCCIREIFRFDNKNGRVEPAGRNGFFFFFFVVGDEQRIFKRITCASACT